MSDAPSWLPGLLRLSDCDGDWHRYLEAAYSVFRADFIITRPQLGGLQIVCRRDPICDGKEAGFWHCTSEGSDEDSRTPDLRRLERIRWIKPILEHADDRSVDRWMNRRRGGPRQLLWYAEEFVVIVAQRPISTASPRYWQLITAFDTPEEHRKRKFRRERDAATKS